MNCWHCARKIEIVTGDRIGFRDECPACGRPLHVCRNCGFYDPAYNNSCRETMAERVADKERSNFCEYFKPASDKSGSSSRQPKSDAQRQAGGTVQERNHDAAEASFLGGAISAGYWY